MAGVGVPEAVVEGVEGLGFGVGGVFAVHLACCDRRGDGGGWLRMGFEGFGGYFLDEVHGGCLVRWRRREATWKVV